MQTAHVTVRDQNTPPTECLCVVPGGRSIEDDFKGGDLAIQGTWLRPTEKIPAVLMCHLLTGGPYFFLYPKDPTSAAPSALRKLRKECLGTSKVGVLFTDDNEEVVLVPLHGKDGAEVYAAYKLVMGAGDVLDQCLASRQLPLVFDLDETLLVAKSQSQLQRDLLELRETRRPALQLQARALQGPEAGAQLAALDREEAQLAADLALLQSFAERDAVEWGGSCVSAKLESVHGEDGSSMSRPVVRLAAPGDHEVVLTRIEPGVPATSMVFHVRPGWRDLAAEIAAQGRHLVYVCTAARRDYALEAWRVLDPSESLMPLDQRPERITCTQAKNLAKVVLRARPGGPRASPDSVPMATIVDDRLDVWDEANRGQVVRIEAFKPYEERAAAADPGNGAALPAQGRGLTWLRTELARISDALFDHIDRVALPAAQALASGQRVVDPACIAEDYAAAMPAPRWAAWAIQNEEAGALPPKTTYEDLTQEPRRADGVVPIDPRRAGRSRWAPAPGMADATLPPADPRAQRRHDAAAGAASTGYDPSVAPDAKRPRVADGGAGAMTGQQPGGQLPQDLIQLLLAVTDSLQQQQQPGAWSGAGQPGHAGLHPAQGTPQGSRPGVAAAQPLRPPMRRRAPASPTRDAGPMPGYPPVATPAAGELAQNVIPMSSALLELRMHFPPTTNNTVFDERVEEGESGAPIFVANLSINGREFVEQGRSDFSAKQARQQAALRVLSKAGFAVDLRPPGGRGGQSGRGGRGRGRARGARGWGAVT